MSQPTRKRSAPAQDAPPKQPQPTEPQGTEHGVHLLRRHLENWRQVGELSWEASCPLPGHEPGHRNLKIDFRYIAWQSEWKLLVACRLHRRPLADICELLGLKQHDVLNNKGLEKTVSHRPKRVDRLPIPQEIEPWRSALWANKPVLNYLRSKRGLDDVTILRHHIGWDGVRIVLPVYDAEGCILNTRRYHPDPPDKDGREGKMLSLAGRGIQLYPDVPQESWLLVCEGEWDTLIARRYGLPSVTSTGGICGWEDEWLSHFEGQDVVIAFDCQDVSNREAVRWAERVGEVAKLVRVVDLRLGHKEDVSDWFVRYGRSAVQLRHLIDKAPIWPGE